MPWGVEYLLSKPLATTMNPGRAESQEWPVRYYFCFDHTKCYYHYRSGLDAFCTVLEPIGPPHHTALKLYIFSIYILMQPPEATDTEMIFFFFHFFCDDKLQLSGTFCRNQWLEMDHFPQHYHYNVHCGCTESVLNDENHQNQYRGFIPAAFYCSPAPCFRLPVSS